METTMAGLKELVFGAGETITVDTSVSGKALKGGEVICVLPQMKYRLTVKVDGVGVADVVDAFTNAALSVKSQAWLKAYAINAGVAGVMQKLGSALEKVEASETVKYSHYTGGQLTLTWAELFSAERAKATPEQKILQAAASLTKEQLLELLAKVAEGK